MTKLIDNIKDALFNKNKQHHNKLPFKVMVKTPEYVDNKDLVIYRYIAIGSSSSIVSKIMKKGKSKFLHNETGNIQKYVSPNNDDNIYFISFKKSHQPNHICKILKLKKIDDETMLERILFVTDNDYNECDKFISDLESNKSVYLKENKIDYTKSYINFENKMEISFVNDKNNNCVIDFRTSNKYKDSQIDKRVKNLVKIMHNEYQIHMKSNNYIKIMNSNC